MTYQHCRHEFSGGPGEAIERPWHSKGAVGVEGLLMFCHDPLNAGVPCDMAHQDLLVIHQVLSHALIGPVVGKILKGDSIRPIIWKWNQDGLLDMICQVTTFTNFSKSVVESSTLGEQPQRVHKMACITLHIQVMLLPEVLQPWQSLEVYRLGHIYRLLYCLL